MEPFLDDVDDLVDHQPHRAAVVGEHQDRLDARGPDADTVHLHQRHQLIAVLHHIAAVGEFDLVGCDFFQPGHQAERHRLGLGRAGAEHQQRGQLFGRAGARRRVLVGDFVGGIARSAERLGDAVGIDDHDDGAIAQNGVAGEHVDVTQLGRHRLDHDFLGVEHAVDHDAEGLAADLGDDDEAVFRIGGGAVVDLEQLLQVHQRQQLVAQTQYRGVLDPLDAMLGIGARPHQFDHRQLRNGKAVAAGFHDQRRDDGERQRNLDGDGGALAGHRLDVDGAADLVDIGAHHVHADAAAGHAGHGGRGREARREDEFVDLRFRHLLEFGLADETVGDRLGLDPLGIEAAAVVGDADDDVAAFMIGGQADGALLRLAGGGPLGRRLQPVIGRVAHHMGQGILDQVEHLPIEFGVGAVHLQFDLLVQVRSDRSRTMRGSFCQALPIGCIRVFMTPSCSSAVTFDSRCSGTLNSVSSLRRDDLQKLVARQHQLRHHRHQVFQRVDIDADRLVGDAIAFGGVRLDNAAFFAAGFGALRRRFRLGLALAPAGR